MSTITTRAGKGSPLTNAEVDANFENLNADKLESVSQSDVTQHQAALSITESQISDLDKYTQQEVDDLLSSLEAYATAAQGALADSALQSGDNVSELTNDAGYATTGYVDTAESDAISTAATDATTKANTAETNAKSYADGIVATEASARSTGDSNTLSSAQSYTDTAISNLVDTAPATLDTLNELAAALGDDPNFATTVSGQIGTAQSTADTALANANAALAKDPTLTLAGDASGSATFTNLGNATLTVTVADDSHNHVISNVDGLQAALDGKVDDSQVLTNVPAGAVFTDTVYTHPTHPGDDFSVDTGPLTGATVVSDIDINVTTDTLGHVTDANGVVSTRTLTLGDLGYTGATDANKYVHPSHPGDDINLDTGPLTGATVISDLDFNVTTDTQGHVTDANASVATRTLTPANIGAMATSHPANNITSTHLYMSNGDGFVWNDTTNVMSVRKDGTDYVNIDAGNISSYANNYTHPSHPGDDINLDTGALSGATVISDLDFNVTTDTLGHVTDANATVATRNLTLANLGYTGATNANYYTHPSYAGDDINLDTGALSGATVISDLDFNVTTDTQGHVTDANATYSTRNLTYSDVGAAAASHSHSYLPLSGGTITGNVTFTGADGENALTLSGTSPTLAFTDTGSEDDFYIHVNSNNFYVLRDAGGAGGYGAWDSPHALQLEGDTNIGYLFGDRIFDEGYHPNADKWTTARTLSLTGDVTGSVSWDGSGNVSMSTAVGDAQTIDGYDSSRFFRRQSKATATVGGGWMTVAEATSGRQAGEVIVTDGDSGDHAYIRIHWMHSYADSNFTVINCGGHANRITGARVLYNTSDITYGNYKLQVYVTTSSNYEVNVYELGDINDYGCPSVVTPVIQNSITGYAVHGNELTDLGSYGHAAEEGIIAGGSIRSNTGMNVNGNTVWHAGNDGSGSGLDADKLDGVQGSSFLRSDANDTATGALTLKNDSGVFVQAATNAHANGARIKFSDNAGGSFAQYGSIEYHHADGYWDSYSGLTVCGDGFHFKGTEATTGFYFDGILKSDNIRIGAGLNLQESSDRADLLQITSNTSGWAGLQIRNSSNEGRWSFMTDGEYAGIYNDEDNQWHIYMQEGGYTQLRYGSSTKLQTSSSGVTVTGTLTETSDRRLKKDIEILDNALDRVGKLNGYTFTMIDNEERQTGVIAQEVQEVLPEAVQEDEEGTLSVSYGNMVGLLIEAIKEQQTQIDELKAQVEALNK